MDMASHRLTRASLLATLLFTGVFPSHARNTTVNGALTDLDGDGDGGAGEAVILQTAVSCWDARITTNRNFTLNVNTAAMAPGLRGTGAVTSLSGNVPDAGRITMAQRVATDNSILNWFVDTTPLDNLEFDPDPNNQWRFINGTGGADLLRSVMHEIGHASGWLCGNSSCSPPSDNPNYDALMVPQPANFSNGTNVTLQANPGFNVPLRGDGLDPTAGNIVNELSHVGPNLGGNGVGDMMYGLTGANIRETHSVNDLDMFVRAYGDTVNFPPTVNAGPDQVSECNSTGGSTVLLDASASTDPENDALSYSWTCSAGVVPNTPNTDSTNAFVLLNQSTTCRVDAADLAACPGEADVVSVSVVDTTAPTVNCPDDITLECTAPGGVPANHPEIIVFLAAAFANDVCDAAPALSNNAPAFFRLGSNEVEFTANDNQSNLASCSANVIVDDTTPPEIQSISATPDNLWSPNHKMVPVTVSVDVQDTCDAAPVCRIVGVSTNEAELGPGSGNTSPDWSIEGGLTVNLRSERSGRGSGRIYDVAVECEDASGNAAQGSVAVSVAHDKS